MNKEIEKNPKSFREKIYVVIYGHNTPAGKLFDIILLILILLSVLAVMLETVADFRNRFYTELIILEYIFTGLFTIEYILRIYSTRRPWKYIFSFYGIIDLLAILPMYLAFFFTGTHLIASIRGLRLLRVFRILKMSRFIGESAKLTRALRDSRPKIIIFLFAVLIICIIMGTVIYLVEDEESGFTSIPMSIYWCVVTMTTVGYGDIIPMTSLGKFIATFIMITGYGIIAVPTGIVSAEITKGELKGTSESKPGPICPVCTTAAPKEKAEYCYNCGSQLIS